MVDHTVTPYNHFADITHIPLSLLTHDLFAHADELY